MSTQARPITSIGTLPPLKDCRVPDDAKVLELKGCENCLRLFARTRVQLRPLLVSNIEWGDGREVWDSPKKLIFVDPGPKYCPTCCRAMLLPVEDREYRDELPTSAAMKHRTYLPHYDGSLVDPEHRLRTRPTPAPPPPKRWKKNFLGDWKTRLIQALIDRGPLTCKQMAEITGHSVSDARGMLNYSLVVSTARAAGIFVQAVGSVWPRPSCMGPAPKLYALVQSDASA